jgi:TonB family protein
VGWAAGAAAVASVSFILAVISGTTLALVLHPGAPPGVATPTFLHSDTSSISLPPDPAVAYLYLVRPMRGRLLSAVLIMLFTHAFAQSGIPAEALRSATFSYQTQINTIILQAVVPELAKHVNLLKGMVKFSFRLNRQGHLNSLKVTSSTSNRFVEQTTIRMIRATKFPPIPKKVIAEQGHDYVDVDSEIDMDRH